MINLNQKSHLLKILIKQFPDQDAEKLWAKIDNIDDVAYKQLLALHYNHEDQPFKDYFQHEYAKRKN